MAERNPVFRLYGVLGNERGLSSESRLGLAVSRALEQGNLPKWLSGFQKPSAKEDAKGIDGWAVTDVDKIPIQVKSSKTGAKRAKAKYPEIPILIVRPGDTEATIVERFSSVIGQKRSQYLKQRKNL